MGVSSVSEMQPVILNRTLHLLTVVLNITIRLRIKNHSRLIIHRNSTDVLVCFARKKGLNKCPMFFNGFRLSSKLGMFSNKCCAVP
jgi:hypothetical protein